MMLCSLKQYPDIIEVDILQDIPDDVELVKVFYMPAEMCFGFLLAHESFDAVPEGCRVEFKAYPARRVQLNLGAIDRQSAALNIAFEHISDNDVLFQMRQALQL